MTSTLQTDKSNYRLARVRAAMALHYMAALRRLVASGLHPALREEAVMNFLFWRTRADLWRTIAARLARSEGFFEF